jgi:type II secretory pathway component PulF
MPNFKYRVRDRSAKAMAGTIDAPILEMAGDRLFQLGYFPVKIEEQGGNASLNVPDLWQRFQKVKLEKIVSCDSVALRWRIFRNFG